MPPNYLPEPFRLAIVVAALLSIVGCGGDGNNKSNDAGSGSTATASTDSVDSPKVDAKTTDAKPDSQASVTANSGKSDAVAKAAAPGTLTGVITFAGDLPAPRKIQATKDTAVCMKGAGDVQDVVVADGKLHGVVVELTVPKSTPLDLKWNDPVEGYVIRQKDCRFSPRLIVLHDGAEIGVFNDDSVQHNINAETFNVVQSPSKTPITTTMKYAGVSFVRVTCNIHNWMETWVYVAQTPLYAASGEDGQFKIEGIPPGKYRGLATHPTLGKQRFNVEIKADEATTQDFVFEAK